MPDQTNATSSTPRTVAVTGATGFVGRHLVRELLSRGHAVTALARSKSKASEVLPGGARVVEGDVLTPGVCERLVEGADACCHLIGIIREARGRQTFERMHVNATERILEACGGAANPMRYVHMSALGVCPEGPAEYQTTKFGAEQKVQSSSTDWTIFRPGLIHGPDGEFMQMAKDWCQGRATPRVFIPYFSRVRMDDSFYIPIPKCDTPVVAPVHVDDVAWAFAEALDRPESVGEIIPLVGPEEMGIDDMLKTMRDALPVSRKSMPTIGVPGIAARAKAKALSAVGAGGMLPFDEGMAVMGSQDSVAPLDKAHAELGFTPRGYTDTVRAYAADM